MSGKEEILEEPEVDVEDELLGDELDEPELEGEFVDDVVPVIDEDDDEDDEDAVPVARKVADDDDDDEDDDDVEADLDAILKDRLASSDDDEDEDEEPPAPTDPNSVAGKRDGEFVCGNCFMLVSAQGPTCSMGDGYEPCSPM